MSTLATRCTIVKSVLVENELVPLSVVDIQKLGYTLITFVVNKDVHKNRGIILLISNRTN